MRVTIVGTGQMAVMCARLLCDNGHDVSLLGRRETIEQMRQTGRSRQLSEVTLPDVRLTSDFEAATQQLDVAVMAVPTQQTRALVDQLSDSGRPVVSCAKGIELSTNLRPSQLLGRRPVAVLSGPNIAGEVVARKAAGAVVACEDQGVAEQVRDLFATDYFRVYTSDDVVGVELAGATKNIIAIAAGIVDGLDLGNNAKAALITRGLVEITRLGESMGARPDTFAGLAGMGDLITTCFSPEGRNRRFGEHLGRGMSTDEALAKLGSVCEGVPTTKAVAGIARERGVEMPITHSVAGILFDGVDPREALGRLMRREPKPE